MINIKKSINWLYKRFKDAKESKYKSFKVSEADFNAFLEVVEYIDIIHKNKVAENTLFAKLYIYHLNQIIDKYETDVLEDIPQKELSKILNLPLDSFYKAFHSKIQNNWNDKIISKIKDGDKDAIKQWVAVKYSEEHVEETLDYMINQALTRFE